MVMAHLFDGQECPVCSQWVEARGRRITPKLARQLIAMWKHAGVMVWFHYSDALDGSGTGHPSDYAKLRYWGLIEREKNVLGERGRVGWWRITKLGVRYIKNEVALPEWALMYNRQFHGLRGAPRGIGDVLGPGYVPPKR